MTTNSSHFEMLTLMFPKGLEALTFARSFLRNLLNESKSNHPIYATMSSTNELKSSTNEPKSSTNDPNAGLSPDAKEAKFLYLALSTMAENAGKVSVQP